MIPSPQSVFLLYGFDFANLDSERGRAPFQEPPALERSARNEDHRRHTLYPRDWMGVARMDGRSSADRFLYARVSVSVPRRRIQRCRFIPGAHRILDLVRMGIPMEDRPISAGFVPIVLDNFSSQSRSLGGRDPFWI